MRYSESIANFNIIQHKDPSGTILGLQELIAKPLVNVLEEVLMNLPWFTLTRPTGEYTVNTKVYEQKFDVYDLKNRWEAPINKLAFLLDCHINHKEIVYDWKRPFHHTTIRASTHGTPRKLNLQSETIIELCEGFYIVPCFEEGTQMAPLNVCFQYWHSVWHRYRVSKKDFTLQTANSWNNVKCSRWWHLYSGHQRTMFKVCLSCADQERTIQNEKGTEKGRKSL